MLVYSYHSPLKILRWQFSERLPKVKPDGTLDEELLEDDAQRRERTKVAMATLLAPLLEKDSIVWRFVLREILNIQDPAVAARVMLFLSTKSPIDRTNVVERIAEDFVPILIDPIDEGRDPNLKGIVQQATDWMKDRILSDADKVFLWINGDDSVPRIANPESLISRTVLGQHGTNGGVCLRRIQGLPQSMNTGGVFWGTVEGSAILDCMSIGDSWDKFFGAVVQAYQAGKSGV